MRKAVHLLQASWNHMQSMHLQICRVLPWRCIGRSFHWPLRISVRLGRPLRRRRLMLTWRMVSQ